MRHSALSPELRDAQFGPAILTSWMPLLDLAVFGDPRRGRYRFCENNTRYSTPSGPQGCPSVGVYGTTYAENGPRAANPGARFVLRATSSASSGEGATSVGSSNGGHVPVAENGASAKISAAARLRRRSRWQHTRKAPSRRRRWQRHCPRRMPSELELDGRSHLPEMGRGQLDRRANTLVRSAPFRGNLPHGV